MRSQAQTGIRTVCVDSLNLTFKVGNPVLPPVQSYFSVESHLLPEMPIASTVIERSQTLRN
jgi:hypothetical protein